MYIPVCNVNPYIIILAVVIFFLLNAYTTRFLCYFYVLKNPVVLPSLFKYFFCNSLYNCKQKCCLCLSWESPFHVAYYCMDGEGNHEYWKCHGKLTLQDTFWCFRSGVIAHRYLCIWRVISQWQWNVPLTKSINQARNKRKQKKKKKKKDNTTTTINSIGTNGCKDACLCKILLLHRKRHWSVL